MMSNIFSILYRALMCFVLVQLCPQSLSLPIYTSTSNDHEVISSSSSSSRSKSDVGITNRIVLEKHNLFRGEQGGAISVDKNQPFSTTSQQRINFAKYVNAATTRLGTNYDVNKPVNSFLNISKECKADFNDQVRVLIMGDSINRFMVDEICTGRNYPTAWGRKFSTKGSAMVNAARVCVNPANKNMVFAFLNILGSNKTGPYLRNSVKSENDPYVDTIDRIPEGIAQFKEFFGEPHFVFYRTELWDLHIYLPVNNTPSSPTYQVDINNFKIRREELIGGYLKNIEWAFNLLREAAPNAYLGTHTIPTISWGYHLFFQYLNAQRHYATTHEESFIFDWNIVVSHIPISESLRDGHHPVRPLNVHFGEYILKLCYEWMCSGAK